MSLIEVWDAAPANSFQPIVSKDSQFTVGFNLLMIGTISTYRSSSLGTNGFLLSNCPHGAFRSQ